MRLGRARESAAPPSVRRGPRRPRHLGHSSGAALPLLPQDGGGRVSDMPGHVARIAPRPPAPRGLYGSAGHTGGGGEGRTGGRSRGARTAPPLSAASARRALSPPRPSGVLARGLGSLLPAGRGGGGSRLGRPGRESFHGPFTPAGDAARPRASGAGSGAPRPIAAFPGSGRAGRRGWREVRAGWRPPVAPHPVPRRASERAAGRGGGQVPCRRRSRRGGGDEGGWRVGRRGGGVFRLCFSPPFCPPGSSPFFLPSLFPLPAPSVTGLRNCGCLKLNVIFTVPAGVCNVSDK